MKITKETVLYVADLAHLELKEAEVETYRQQLDQILTYVEKLNEVNTSGVDPLAQVVASAGDPAAGWREDREHQSDVAGEALDAAPDPQPPYFRVPKVIERDA